MTTRLNSTNLQLNPKSIVSYLDVEYGLVDSPLGFRLAVLAPPHATAVEAFEGETSEFNGQTLLVGPQSARNAISLRTQLPWLQPKLLGLNTSAGMGDRLGIATPGHVRVAKEFKNRIAPIFAQQSIREMNRTGRNPQQVMNDVIWGVFEEGWQGSMGADADHLKSTADIDACLTAGFTLFTIDPGEFVDNSSERDGLNALNEKADHLPAQLHLPNTSLIRRAFDIEGIQIVLDEPTLLKAMVKYGNAIAHVVTMYGHLQQAAKNQPFEVEISMDETELPTSPAEHIYIASELQRLGVKWMSFAPRFIGRFEKGVDYIGDVAVFRSDLAIHAAIAQLLGPYKLSLHSGSDKFSIYPAFMEKTHGLAHLKTAGTSYLEALRTIATINPGLLKEIYSFALEHFETDRLSYHVSARVNQAPKPGEIKDWTKILDQFDAREILHVTFGSVLSERNEVGELRFYNDVISILRTNRESYFTNLENHFKRHFEFFSFEGSG
jgi:hypothetical protein